MRDFLAAIVALCVVLIVTAVNASPDVAIRQAGWIALVANTPGQVGPNPQGRVELQFKNDGPNDVCCGYTPAALNCATPGANAGARYKSGEGIIRCVFPDKTLYCVDASGGSKISVDEAYMRTATATATATSTPTNTP